MRVAVQKLPGVSSVEVSLEAGVATIRFEAGARPPIAQVARAIRDNGFTPKEATLRIRGRVVEEGGQLFLQVPNSGRYPLRGGTGAVVSTDRLRQVVGSRVEVVGRVAEGAAETEGLPPLEVLELTLQP